MSNNQIEDQPMELDEVIKEDQKAIDKGLNNSQNKSKTFTLKVILI